MLKMNLVLADFGILKNLKKLQNAGDWFSS